MWGRWVGFPPLLLIGSVKERLPAPLRDAQFGVVTMMVVTGSSSSG